MRRGGPIFLVLAVVFLLVIGGLGFFAYSTGALDSLLGISQTPATPDVVFVKIVTAGQPIKKDQQITSDFLTTIDMPQDRVNETMITDGQELIGNFAKLDIGQGWVLSADMFSDSPGAVSSKVILPGQVAISLPAKRIDMVGYAIKDGDYVDVIATTLFVDLDANFQSKLPNSLGQIVNIGSPPESAPLAVLGMNNGAGSTTKAAGRAELDPTLNQVIYFVPSESQRPRLVSQMILQDIQVLHVGEFALAAAEVPPTPDPAQGGQAAPTAVPVVEEPDLITLIVSPQDAVSLTYLQYSPGTKLTFVLRAPDDRSRAETEAATLQYILSQYNIPIPAKLPYGMEPAAAELPKFDVVLTVTPRP